MSTGLSEERFFQREFSWLAFNSRVLEQAIDAANPLLERLKFLGIVSSNLDEFFMVRVASHAAKADFLGELYQRSFELARRQYGVFKSSILPEMESAKIVRMQPETLTKNQHEYLQKYYEKEILPVLTPVAIREGSPTPFLINLSLYKIFELTGPKEKQGSHFALVEIPKKLTRMIMLPAEGNFPYILLEDAVSFFAKDLFRGYQILNHGTFRISRGAETTINEEKDEDFAEVMSEALLARKHSLIVRLESSGPANLMEWVRNKLNIEPGKVFPVEGWMDFKSISRFAFQPGFENLKRLKWTPRAHPVLGETDNVWEAIREKDRLMHVPYESFETFLRFLSAAAEDPDVLAIKQTLYRLADPSRVMDCLEKAAINGKQVTVLIELKARFDEEQNIEGANRLMTAGATVLYGIAGLKTHAKACLVVRRESERIQRYAHVSTGNYNEETAKLYSDVSLFSANDELTADIAAFFNMITGYSQPTGFSRIETAPYGLRGRLKRLILREEMKHSKQSPGLIMLKFNSLVDHEMIETLYRVSQSGVKVRLNVRGICCLKPGVKGMSENIEVISVVDMFLEHSRIFYFHNGGEAEIYISSADLMPRNLDRRIELICRVDDKEMKSELTALLQTYFQDNTNAWILQPDGSYLRKQPDKEKKFRAQEYLCQKAVEQEKTGKMSRLKELKPQKPAAQNIRNPGIQIAPPESA